MVLYKTNDIVNSFYFSISRKKRDHICLSHLHTFDFSVAQRKALVEMNLYLVFSVTAYLIEVLYNINTIS